MENALRTLLRDPLTSTVAVGGLSVLVLLFASFQAFEIRKTRKAWARLMHKSSGEGLESMLQRHLEFHATTLASLADAKEQIQMLESKMRTAQRYVGLVRYDAFGDIGGQQSFSLAVYDEEGRGAVLTSQVGRETCRVYCKELVKGSSDRPLASEEALAVDAAAARSRPRIAR